MFDNERKEWHVGDTTEAGATILEVLVPDPSDRTYGHGHRVRIKCLTCSRDRVIYVQDAHQVAHCRACCFRARNDRRNERRREKRRIARLRRQNDDTADV